MIKVLTYNIHKGFNRYNRDFVLHRIKEQLQQAQVDVVMLQEIHGRHLRHAERIHDWPMESQFEYLADQVWPHYAYGKNAIYRRGHHGNAILSKYPLVEWNNLNLSRFRGASRSLLHGRIEIPGNDCRLHLMCVHLDLFGFERKRQLLQLKSYIDGCVGADDALIIGGDFNDWHGGLGRSLEAQLQMREALQQTFGNYARTFPSHRPMLRMDRIYYRKLQLVDAGCLQRTPWNELSDHLPLHAEFSFD